MYPPGAFFIIVYMLLHVFTKTSPFGATARWRACPRLSAKTDAQNPAGSTMPASPSHVFALSGAVLAAASGAAVVSDFEGAQPVREQAAATVRRISVKRVMACSFER